jgi:deoxyribonuclease-4
MTDPKLDFIIQLRTRQVVDRLDLKALQASKVIPKIWDKNIDDLDEKSLPEWVVKTKNYSKYGLQRENEIRKMILDCNSNSNNSSNNSEFKNKNHPEHKTIQKFTDCSEMCKYISKFDNWQFDQELYTEYKNGSSIVGHPDLFSESMVADVKTTIHWSKTRMYAIAQLCVYAILSNVNKICVILPLSNTCAFHTFTDMKTELYDLRRCIYNTLQFYPYAYINYFKEKYNVGSHISKATALGYSDVLANQNIQIFLGNPQSASVPKIDTESMKKLQTLAKNNKLFVHAPYVVLLSSEQKYVIKSIQETMQLASKIGVKGVVYHIGSGTEEAMLSNLKEVEPFISKDCPLIIETSCGEGNEILVKKDELLNFVKQLNLEKFRMCCDTCHIYTSPNSGTVYECMKYYESHIPGIISITHFNNSAHPKKSCKDKHAHYWGFLSFDLMDSIANFCFERNIPMVTE